MATQTATPVPTQNPPGARPGFRTDIEGLRGVAIIMVILAHLGVGIHGGVDVSFALSGFLVTFLLLQEKSKTGRIKFGKFYARRARRLLPAATLVTLATLAGAYLWMSPLRLEGVAKDGWFASLSIVNWKLAADGTDYFANQALSPFQHFWSLSVEEQFYLFGPLVILGALWLAKKYGNIRHASLVLTCIAMMSLGMSVIWTNLAQPWAYFGTHTRAWELLFGAALAMWANDLKRLPETVAAILSWTGLAVIIGTGIMITEQTPLPGYAVGGPVLGALMIMAGGCANPAKGAVQLLGLGSLRYIGRISYSLYLWHWPIVVILPDITGRPLNTTDKLFVAALTFVLSVLTFHLVERPIRERKSLTNQPRKGLTLGGLLITGTASACAFVTFFMAPISTAAAQQIPTAPVGDVERLVAEGAKLKQLSPQILASLPGIKQREGQLTCIEGPLTVKPHPCTFGDATSPREVVLLGDSHALQWTPTFDLLGKEQGFKLTSFSKAACTPEPYSNIDDHLKRIYTECEQWREMVIGDILARKPQAVIASAGVFEGASGQAAGNLAKRFIDAGIKYALIDDSPGPFKDMPECLSKKADNASACATPRKQALYRSNIRKDRGEAVTKAGGTFIDIADWFCTADACPGVVNGVVVYIDGSHVSATYARWLAPRFAEALRPMLN